MYYGAIQKTAFKKAEKMMKTLAKQYNKEHPDNKIVHKEDVRKILLLKDYISKNELFGKCLKTYYNGALMDWNDDLKYNEKFELPRLIKKVEDGYKCAYLTQVTHTYAIRELEAEDFLATEQDVYDFYAYTHRESIDRNKKDLKKAEKAMKDAKLANNQIDYIFAEANYEIVKLTYEIGEQNLNERKVSTRKVFDKVRPKMLAEFRTYSTYMSQSSEKIYNSLLKILFINPDFDISPLILSYSEFNKKCQEKYSDLITKERLAHEVQHYYYEYLHPERNINIMSCDIFLEDVNHMVKPDNIKIKLP